MKRKMRSHSKEFKFKVAVEMLKEDLTVAEIASKYAIAISVATSNFKFKKYEK